MTKSVWERVSEYHEGHRVALCVVEAVAWADDYLGEAEHRLAKLGDVSESQEVRRMRERLKMIATREGDSCESM